MGKCFNKLLKTLKILRFSTPNQVSMTLLKSIALDWKKTKNGIGQFMRSVIGLLQLLGSTEMAKKLGKTVESVKIFET